MSVEVNENSAGEEIEEMPSSSSAEATLPPEESLGSEKPLPEASNPLVENKEPVESENPSADEIAEPDSLAFLEDPPIEPLPAPVRLVDQPEPEPEPEPYDIQLDEFLEAESNNDLMQLFAGERVNEPRPSTSSGDTASDDASINFPIGSIYNPIVLE